MTGSSKVAEGMWASLSRPQSADFVITSPTYLARNDAPSVRYSDNAPAGSFQEHMEGVNEHAKLKTIETGESAHYVEKNVRFNKGMMGGPVNEVGEYISALTQLRGSQKHLPKVAKSLFPRSVVYEIEYNKKQYEKQMILAIERERKAFELKLAAKAAKMPEHNPNDDEGNTPKQVNYVGGPQGTTPLPTSPAQQPAQEHPSAQTNIPATNAAHPPQHGLEAVGSCNRGPDSVAGGCCCGAGGRSCGCPPDCNCQAGRGVPKDGNSPGTQDGSAGVQGWATGLAVGQKVDRGPLPGWKFGEMDFRGRPATDWPPSPPRLTQPWGELRQAELMRTGLPFKAAAARWAECNIPTFDPEKEDRAMRLELLQKIK